MTDTGFDLIERSVADHVETQNTLLKGLSDDEIAQLDVVLRKLLDAREDSDT